MPFIDQTGAEALIDEEIINEIFADVATTESRLLPLMRRLPDMNAAQQKLRVLSALPMVYWRDGATGHSQPAARRTTKLEWENKYVTAETMDAIVSVPEEIWQDTNFDLWAQAKPYIEAGVVKCFDATLLHSENKPSSFPDGIVDLAIAAGRTVALDSIGNDIYDDLYAENGICDQVWEQGYDVLGAVGATRLKSVMTGARDVESGLPLFPELHKGGGATIAGSGIVFPTNGAVDQTQMLLAAGQFDKFVYAFRKDVYYRTLTEASITDPVTGENINFAQNGMVGLLVSFRAGWQVPNPVNEMGTSDETRFPVAVLTPSAGS